MLQVGPAEFMVIGLVLLIVVGPEQLPGLVRRVGQMVSQVRDVTDGLRNEFMAGIEEIEQATDVSSWAGDGDEASGKTNASTDRTVDRGAALAYPEPEGDDSVPSLDDPVDTEASTANGSAVGHHNGAGDHVDPAGVDDDGVDPAGVDGDSVDDDGVEDDGVDDDGVDAAVASASIPAPPAPFSGSRPDPVDGPAVAADSEAVAADGPAVAADGEAVAADGTPGERS